MGCCKQGQCLKTTLTEVASLTERSVTNKKEDARLKKAKNPTTSVIVVTKTPEAIAGSMRHFSSKMGRATPAIPATTRLITIAPAIISPRET